MFGRCAKPIELLRRGTVLADDMTSADTPLRRHVHQESLPGIPVTHILHLVDTKSLEDLSLISQMI